MYLATVYSRKPRVLWRSDRESGGYVASLHRLIWREKLSQLTKTLFVSWKLNLKLLTLFQQILKLISFFFFFKRRVNIVSQAVKRCKMDLNRPTHQKSNHIYGQERFVVSNLNFGFLGAWYLNPVLYSGQFVLNTPWMPKNK